MYCFENDSMDTLLWDTLWDAAKYQQDAEMFGNGDVKKCAQLSWIINDSNSSMRKSNEIPQKYINDEKQYSQAGNEMEHFSMYLN